jgi:hypothetical protein
VAQLSTAAQEEEVEAEAQEEEELSQKVTEAAGKTAEAVGTTAEKQKPEGAGIQEVRRRVSLEASLELSRKVSLEVRQLPTQQIPQDLT